jgi:predicted ester cyclase
MFSNRRFIVEEQVAEADKVVTRFTVHVTHDERSFWALRPSAGRRATRQSSSTVYLAARSLRSGAWERGSQN